MSALPPSEDELQAYIDEQLPAERRAVVAAFLQQHPEQAAQVERWRQDARQLRAALANLQAQPSNPRLDPQAIRRGRQQRQRRRLASAMALLLSLGLGLGGGWQLREQSLMAANPPMQDALTAHRLFAIDTEAALDVAADEAGLRSWLSGHFSHAALLPDLQRLGLHAVGGRLLTTEQGPAALVVLEDEQGQRLSLYLRAPGSLYADMPAGQRADGELQARYWSGQGYNYALVSARDTARSAQLQQALRL